MIVSRMKLQTFLNWQTKILIKNIEDYYRIYKSASKNNTVRFFKREFCGIY